MGNVPYLWREWITSVNHTQDRDIRGTNRPMNHHVCTQELQMKTEPARMHRRSQPRYKTHARYKKVTRSNHTLRLGNRPLIGM
jgi:hypothetical protein